MKRDEVTDPKQFIKREVINGSPRRAVKGNDTPPKGPQPLHNSGPDPPGPDNPHGEITQFSTPNPKPEVPVLSPPENGRDIPNNHEHQHQGVVGNTVRRIGNIPHRDPHPSSAGNINVVKPHAPRGDIPDPNLSKSPKNRRGDRSLVPNAHTRKPASKPDIALTQGIPDNDNTNPKPRSHHPNQGGLITLTPIDSNTARSSLNPTEGSPTFAQDHARDPTENDVAHPYQVPDTRTTSYPPVTHPPKKAAHS